MPIGRKNKHEDIAAAFAEQGCELLEKYTGSQTPMKYRCRCGREAITRWNDFQYGKRCGYCDPTGRKKKYTIEEVAEIFKQRGCELLATEYRTNKTPLEYRCKCGNASKISFVAFVFQGQYCHKCGLEKNKKEGHHCWISDRQEKRRRDLFRKKCYKALASTLEAVSKEKVGHTSDMIGYGPKELREHIEKHPNWNRVKEGDWHLDHIFPINAFLEYGITDVALINCLENLRPVTQRENNLKSYSYDKDEFIVWLKTRGVKP